LNAGRVLVRNNPPASCMAPGRSGGVSQLITADEMNRELPPPPPPAALTGIVSAAGSKNTHCVLGENPASCLVPWRLLVAVL